MMAEYKWCGYKLTVEKGKTYTVSVPALDSDIRYLCFSVDRVVWVCLCCFLSYVQRSMVAICVLKQAKSVTAIRFKRYMLGLG